MDPPDITLAAMLEEPTFPSPSEEDYRATARILLTQISQEDMIPEEFRSPFARIFNRLKQVQSDVDEAITLEKFGEVLAELEISYSNYNDEGEPIHTFPGAGELPGDFIALLNVQIKILGAMLTIYFERNSAG